MDTNIEFFVNDIYNHYNFGLGKFLVGYLCVIDVEIFVSVLISLS